MQKVGVQCTQSIMPFEKSRQRNYWIVTEKNTVVNNKLLAVLDKRPCCRFTKSREFTLGISLLEIFFSNVGIGL